VVAEHATVGGTPGADDIFIETFATGTLRGLGGNDRLVAYDGNDTIEGGDGDDYLEGGFGNDVLDGGGGKDQFSGDRIESNVFAAGSDDIRARDGVAEQIGCGIGGDKATVDTADVVAPDCEQVLRPDGIDDPLVPGAPETVGKLTPRAVARKGLRVSISCPAACEVAARLRVGKKLARKLKLGRSRVLARGSAEGTGEVVVTLKVAQKARKRLKRQKRVKATLTTVTSIAGRDTEAKLGVTLKR
jgi:Ca2+-binding RTX toxin-like protein